MTQYSADAGRADIGAQRNMRSTSWPQGQSFPRAVERADPGRAVDPRGAPGSTSAEVSARRAIPPVRTAYRPGRSRRRHPSGRTSPSTAGCSPGQPAPPTETGRDPSHTGPGCPRSRNRGCRQPDRGRGRPEHGQCSPGSNGMLGSKSIMCGPAGPVVDCFSTSAKLTHGPASGSDEVRFPDSSMSNSQIP